MAEHLLDAAQVGAALEQVRREGMSEEMRVDALGLETGALGEPAENQEGTGPRQRSALGVQEQIGRWRRSR